MELEINVAVSYTKVNTVNKIIDVPEENKYFIKGELGDFGLNVSVFAILIKFINPGKYLLVKVERNTQEFTDFHIEKDVRSEYWLKDGNNNLRREALDIITKTDYEYNEISEDEFNTSRDFLLNQYKVK